MYDVVVIGGGVIGLNTAYELAGRKLRVIVLDAQQPGREASWAGAGILPPGRAGDPQHPLSQLCEATHRLWPNLSAELREVTGIDNGFRHCGGLCVASGEWSADSINAEYEEWQRAGVRVERLSPEELRHREPQLGPTAAGFRLADQCQVRNPRHLKALEIACARHGVEIRAGQAVMAFDRAGERVHSVQTTTDRYSAGAYLVTTGAWTEALLAPLGCSLRVVPVRGQIVLLTQAPPAITHVIESGSRYLVPRPDGRVLIGATEEWVGFDKRNTATAVKELLAFGESLVPALASARFETAWSGLRPQAVDGLPFLGRIPDAQNLFVAAGHFRSGLHLSAITSRVMSQIMTDEVPDVRLDAFRPDRSSAL